MISDNTRQAWQCIIGSTKGVTVPSAADIPMRRAVAAEYTRLTGEEPEAIFSGWGARFTDAQLHAIDPNRYEMQYAGSTHTSAARDVLAERARQVNAEGWTPEHDDEHEIGELATAAACYVSDTAMYRDEGDPPPWWPWGKTWWKPSSRRRNLIKAGALILAEIERLDRAAITKAKEAA